MSLSSITSSISNEILPEITVGSACPLTSAQTTDIQTLNDNFEESLEVLRQLMTPIQFAHHLHIINDYLDLELAKKEAKLSLRREYSSNASVASSFHRFYGKSCGLNSTNHDCRQLNSKLFQQSCDRSEVQSSFGGNSRILSGIYGNQEKRKFQQSYSSLGGSFNHVNDTVHNVNCNGYVNGNCQQRFTSLTSTTLESSMFRTHQNSLALKRKENNQNSHNVNVTNGQTSDLYECVRVAPLSREFRLPIIQENEIDREDSEDDEEIVAEKEVVNSTTTAVTPSTASNEGIENKKVVGPSVLKDWTLVLINKELHLKGSKVINNVVEKNFISSPIVSRTVEGKVKTQDSIYVLKGLFTPNEAMPETAKLLIPKSGTFPRSWRKLLESWLKESKKSNDTHEKIAIKPCRVVLSRIVLELFQKAAIENTRKQDRQESSSSSNGKSKNNKSEESTSTKRVTRKQQHKKENINNSNNLKDKKKNNKKETTTKNVKDSPIIKQVKTKKNNEIDNSKNNDSTETVKKDNKRKRDKSHSNEVRNTKIRRDEKINENAQLKDKKKKQTQKSTTSVTDKPEKESEERIYADLFGEGTSNMTLENQALCTPSALLNSLKKSTRDTTTRYTPPFQFMGDLLNKNKEKPKNLEKSFLVKPSMDNPVAKRMAKMKGVKKCTNKKGTKNANAKTAANELNISVQNIIEALSNKTPQTTPVLVRKVFRSESSSDEYQE